MAHRRILSLWFPRLAAERLLRGRKDALPLAFAVVADQSGAQVLASLNPEAERAGLRLGQPLRDATAMCPALVTRPADPLRDAVFLTVLRRWAGKFSPWVAELPPAALVIDLTGCAHLFGGEAALLTEVEADCAALGLTLRAGIADTPGAAWALARFAGQGVEPARNGDAIEQEARATRSRAVKRRHWERGGAAPALMVPGVLQGVIAAPGQMRQALAALPVAALRLPPDTVAGLARLGLRRIEDIMGLPRAALARRFGTDTLRRLDQALGLEPEPVTPARAPLHFAVRLTFPDPIGLRADVEAALDRLLPVMCAGLQAKARGARRVRLQAFRCDGGVAVAEVGLARPANAPGSIRPLLALKLDGIDAGFGIDCLRLEAVETEPLGARQHLAADVAAPGAGIARTGAYQTGAYQVGMYQTGDTALDDLVGKLVAKLGTEAVTRLHPAQSHIPEKAALVLTAAWSDPAPIPWPAPSVPRPLTLFHPEAVQAPESCDLPLSFRWRKAERNVRQAFGPERITPEWWFDDAVWRNGPRDYWRVETQSGARLWIYFAHGAAVSAGWFCHATFA